MLRNYLDVIAHIAGIHRIYNEFIREELDRSGFSNISYGEIFILWALGDAKTKTTVNEIRNRINYMGSHVNASIRKLAQRGFVCYERSCCDRRVCEVWLSDRGRVVSDLLTKIHNRVMGTPRRTAPLLESAVRTLQQIEQFWIDQRLDQLRYGGDGKSEGPSAACSSETRRRFKRY